MRVNNPITRKNRNGRVPCSNSGRTPFACAVKVAVEGEEQEHRGCQDRRGHQPGLQQYALRMVLIGRVALDQDHRCEDGRNHGQVPGVEESQAPYRQRNCQGFQGVVLDPSWAGDSFGQQEIEAKK